jgi:hypothetical protein
MTITILEFIQSSAFGFASFCKKRYLAKVDRSVKTYNTKCIDGFVTLEYILLSRIILHVWSLPHFPSLIPWSSRLDVCN